MVSSWFADIILPLAVRRRFTYRIPESLSDNIKPGVIVQVKLKGDRFYTGIVSAVHDKPPALKDIKPVTGILHSYPVIGDVQLRFWQWISEYYVCSEGEVMKAALPSATAFTDYRPKIVTTVNMALGYDEEQLNSIIDDLRKAPKQKQTLLTFLRLTGYSGKGDTKPVKRSLLISESASSPAVVDSLIRKGILKAGSKAVSRLHDNTSAGRPLNRLSNIQVKAFNSIKDKFRLRDIVLLHGVTSSGKTEIYIHLIAEQLKKGKQVLYLLPEIALTTQIIVRLKKHFGDITGVYHSRLNGNERVEIWNRVAGFDQDKSYRLVVGVRSSLFLPFSNLGLVIVDEEHDTSYKQNDPAPRYHARDSAIILASMHKAKTLLGSASPSVESYHNATIGKYGLVELQERFGAIKLPDIIIANTREAYRKKLMVSYFTPELLNAMDEALGNNEQIILFQNRRGFAPYIECSECGSVPVCVNCAVNLTYHKSIGQLVCHYCGYSEDIPHKCGNCNSSGLVTRGFGTEKIEDEIKIVFPAARVKRMDQDTTRRKNTFSGIISDLEEKRIDILIGTQMISKGLDCENLTVVGVLNADNLLNFPDFRAHERAFQLMEQVSGRAGRRQKRGKVIIQTSDPLNKIVQLVVRHDYINMFRIQMEERNAFNYPPVCRMVRINIRHRERSLLNHFSEILGDELRNVFGKRRVLGPESPVISQIQKWYIKTILLKIEKEKSHSGMKQLIIETIRKIEKEKGASSLRIAVDVDPY